MTLRQLVARRLSSRIVVRRVLAAMAVGFAVLLMSGSPASAHAELESSDPVSGDVLAVAPSQVTLTFGEQIEFAANAIQVFDDHLRPVKTGPVADVDGQGNRIRVALPAGLARGTYTVSWDVSSEDTHPVSGSFRFSISAPSIVTGVVPPAARNDLAGLLLGIARGTGYVGLALGPGLLLVVILLWQKGLADPRTRRLLYAGLTLLAVATLGEMLFQGVWASGRPLSAIWSSPGTLDTHSHRFDQLHAFRFYLVVAFGIALATSLAGHSSESESSGRAGRVGAEAHLASESASRRGATTTLATAPAPEPAEPPISRWPALLGVATTSAALMATWAYAGHSAVGDTVALALAANLSHVFAMTLWLGGLALIAVVLRPADRGADLATVLPRFSRLAFTCVATLVVTGTYLAWREVRSVDALISTEYGRVLLFKLLGVVALIALGNLARRWVQRHLPSPPRSRIPIGAASVAPASVMTFRPVEYGPPEVRRLRRGVLAELGIALAVLGLTTALVVIVPARQDLVRPFHRVVRGSGVTLVLDLATPRVGDAILDVKVTTTDGRPQPITALHGSISLVSPRIGPLTLRPRSAEGASPSGSEVLEMNLPAAGEWTLQLSVQTSPIDATAFSTQVTVS
jgi:copper transport protein